jgi:hypothetical protein
VALVSEVRCTRVVGYEVLAVGQAVKPIQLKSLIIFDRITHDASLVMPQSFAKAERLTEVAKITMAMKVPILLKNIVSGEI